MRSKTIYKLLRSLVVLLALVSNLKAQDYLIGPSLSYQFQKGSVLKTGA